MAVRIRSCNAAVHERQRRQQTTGRSGFRRSRGPVSGGNGPEGFVIDSKLPKARSFATRNWRLKLWVDSRTGCSYQSGRFWHRLFVTRCICGNSRSTPSKFIARSSTRSKDPSKRKRLSEQLSRWRTTWECRSRRKGSNAARNCPG